MTPEEERLIRKRAVEGTPVRAVADRRRLLAEIDEMRAPTSPTERLDQARAAYDAAFADVHHAVIAACPGLHHVVQHRDHRPPWCPKCGRTDTGAQIKETQ